MNHHIVVKVKENEAEYIALFIVYNDAKKYFELLCKSDELIGIRWQRLIDKKWQTEAVRGCYA